MRAKLQGETSPPFPTHYVEQAIVKRMLRSKYLRNEVQTIAYETAVANEEISYPDLSLKSDR